LYLSNFHGDYLLPHPLIHFIKPFAIGHPSPLDSFPLSFSIFGEGGRRPDEVWRRAGDEGFTAILPYLTVFSAGQALKP
jgi:hypothetical protein